MRLSFILVLGFLLASCQKEKQPQEFREWYYENQEDFKQSVEKAGLQITLLEKPLTVAAIETIPRRRYNQSDFKQALEDLNGFRFFEMQFLSPQSKDFLEHDVESQEQYNDRLQYFMSFPQEDIKFVTSNGDILNIIDYHYERSNSLTPYQSILFSFDFSALPNSPSSYDGELIFTESVLGTGGIQFPVKALKKLPKLILNYDSE